MEEIFLIPFFSRFYSIKQHDKIENYLLLGIRLEYICPQTSAIHFTLQYILK